jgi:methionine biosynthesis protein MetW
MEVGFEKIRITTKPKVRIVKCLGLSHILDRPDAYGESEKHAETYRHISKFLPPMNGFMEKFKKILRPNYNFKEISPDYEDYHKIRHVSRHTDSRLNLISGWVRPNSSLLDVGCGEGIAMDFFKIKRNCQVTGIDTSRTALERLKTKGYDAMLRDIDANGLGLKEDERYDYILLMEVIEHLKWPQKVLLEACSHSNRGVIVTIPNTGFIYWRWQLLNGYFPRQSFMHLRFWTIKDFRIFLNQIDVKPLAFKTELSNAGISGRIRGMFQNLLAYQQCWLLSPS